MVTLDTSRHWVVQWYNVDWVEILEQADITLDVADGPEQAAHRALRQWIDTDLVELDPDDDEQSLLFLVTDSQGNAVKVEILAQRVWKFLAKRI